jgi:2-polyprenyl-6-methoxyphenol hydroxylase-like FAD-dependent oxidoreductase
MSDETLIVGAGPTGLTLAIELLRFGVPVRLIDKSDHAAKWSQALVVQARTLEQFARYRIADKAAAKGHKIDQVNFWSDRNLVASLRFEKIPGRYPYVLLLPQNETEQLLIEHLQSMGGKIERNAELIAFQHSFDGTGVTAEIRRPDGKVEQNRFRWLAGCDGAHSKVRSGLGVSFEGDTVGLHFSLGDLKLLGEDVPGDQLEIHLHKGGDVLFIAKLLGNIHRVIVALHDQQNADAQHVPELADFNGAFESYGLNIRAQSAIWRAPFRVNQRKAGQYRVKSVFLAGDASHIHSPVGGQGMNTGIQDAANLAWKLAAVAKGASETLLDSYNEERGKVGDALLRGTSLGLRAATLASPVLEKLRDFVLHGAIQLEAVQELIAKGISETSIDYRGSSIVVDNSHEGKIHAGDRMPDADQHSSGKTLLSALGSGQHLLVALDVPPQDVPRELNGAIISEINSQGSGWDPPIESLLGKGPQLFLVRPDGYVGLHGKTGGEALLKYAQTVGLDSLASKYTHP